MGNIHKGAHLRRWVWRNRGFCLQRVGRLSLPVLEARLRYPVPEGELHGEDYQHECGEACEDPGEFAVWLEQQDGHDEEGQ